MLVWSSLRCLALALVCVLVCGRARLRSTTASSPMQCIHHASVSWCPCITPAERARCCTSFMEPASSSCARRRCSTTRASCRPWPASQRLAGRWTSRRSTPPPSLRLPTSFTSSTAPSSSAECRCTMCRPRLRCWQQVRRRQGSPRAAGSARSGAGRRGAAVPASQRGALGSGPLPPSVEDITHQ